jgi:transposase
MAPPDRELFLQVDFCKLKECKRIAMRSDKTDTSFAAMIHLGAAVINSR